MEIDLEIQKSRNFQEIQQENEKNDVLKESDEEEKIRIEQEQKILKEIQSKHGNQKVSVILTIEEQMQNLLKEAQKYANFLINRHRMAKKNNSETGSKRKRNRTSQELQQEENDLLSQEEHALAEDNQLSHHLMQQPSNIKGGSLKPYQMVGLNWLISLYETGLNGILADDMGLGKTIQAIALIAFLREFQQINGPHIIVAPLSTLGNWFNEFTKWLPNCKIVKLIARKQQREDIIQNFIKNEQFDVCITSFEGVKICFHALQKIKWRYFIMDEAHKIKNEESELSLVIRELKIHHKLLLTGTPLQNNLHELWSLLNFLMPDLFNSSDIFDDWFAANNQPNAPGVDQKSELDAQNLQMVQQLHKILQPFMLRRTKQEVDSIVPPKKEIHLYVGLTKVQMELYQNMLKSSSITGDAEDKKQYLNKLMQLRKVCNHPYIFDGVEEQSAPPLGEHLVTTSGKLIVLDKLLKKLKAEKHQVLIFSQMTVMLDILEDYCHYQQYEYCRIDGSTDMDTRDSEIKNFVDEQSTKFVFLLSTRAGGLGINLATADTVILYDSDWNPQMDLQAMDRAHRIGQQNQVMVYRLITESTVEEKIVERGTIKLKWDSLVIQQGRLAQKSKTLNKDEIKDMIQYGASQIFKSSGDTITDEDIDQLLQRGQEKTNKINKDIQEKIGVQKPSLELGMNSINIYDFFALEKNQEDEEVLNDLIDLDIYTDINRRRNKPNVNYNINAQLNSMLSPNPAQRPLKIVPEIPDHQLYMNRKRLRELRQKEVDFLFNNSKVNKKPLGNSAARGQETKDDGSVETNHERYGLSIEEKAERDKLQKSGFPKWTQADFTSFIQGCERFGRNEFEKIKEHINYSKGSEVSKSIEEVEKYSKCFWDRIDDIAEKENLIKRIERGEKTIQERQQNEELIIEKCKQYKNPKEEIEFNMNHYMKSRSQFFSLENDQFLIYASFKQGYEKLYYNQFFFPLQANGRKQDNQYNLNHSLDLITTSSNQTKNINELKFNRNRSRTEADLNKRMQSLINVLEKERQNEQIAAPPVPEKPKANPRGGVQKTDNNKSESIMDMELIIQQSDKQNQESEEAIIVKITEKQPQSENKDNKQMQQTSISDMFSSKKRTIEQVESASKPTKSNEQQEPKKGKLKK